MKHERFARQADGRLQERSDFMERPSDNMAHTAQERSDSTHEATAHTVSARHQVPQTAHICQADPRSYPKKGRPGDDAKLCT